MGKEIEHRGGRNVPARTGDFDPEEYAGMPVVVHERPGWSEPVPPESAAFGTRIQFWWSWLIRWFRYPAVAWLYVTEYWYRFAILLGTVVSLIIIYVNR
jgi:hypothetical protein